MCIRDSHKKGHLIQEEAADLLLDKTLMPRKHLFTHGSEEEKDDDDDDDDDKYFDSNYLPKDDDDDKKEMQLIRKNIQTDRMLDLIIKNTTQYQLLANKQEPPQLLNKHTCMM